MCRLHNPDFRGALRPQGSPGLTKLPADIQLPLPFCGASHPPLGSFFPTDSNAAARRWLEHAQDWPAGRMALWGEPGCGKTMLARRWANGTGYWCEGKLLAAVPDLTRVERVVVDGADQCPDEHVLLHLLNSCSETSRLLLLTGTSSPARWTVRLADLSSRLRATLAVAIDPPEDSLLRALLAHHLAVRQLAIPESVQDWLLTRLPRSAAALRDAVLRLDHHSLARHQPITRALARAVIPDLLALGPDDSEGCDDGSMTDER